VCILIGQQTFVERGHASQAQSYEIASSSLWPEVITANGLGDLILHGSKASDGVDKTLTWFMSIRGAFVDICRERRRLRLKLGHGEARMAALQKFNEAANQLRDPRSKLKIAQC
jgi:hypothetical protein